VDKIKSKQGIPIQEMIFMIKAVKEWFERVLERPFYEAEMFRAEILKGNDNHNNVIRPKRFAAKLRQV
jgi:hypothetical protein